MDQVGGLERMPSRFTGQLSRRQVAQLTTDERLQLLRGPRIALLGSVQKLRNIVRTG
jgi:hypothetical protein